MTDTRIIIHPDRIPENADWLKNEKTRAAAKRVHDLVAKKIDERQKGGEGSGWFAPPKGTHGPGSQGGSVTPTHYATTAVAAKDLSVSPELQAGIIEGMGILNSLSEKTGTEHAAILNADGTPVTTPEGQNILQGDKVSTDMLPLMEAAGPDASGLIHTHTDGGSFSPSDIAMFYDTEVPLKHLIVTGPDGQTYRLSRTPRSATFDSWEEAQQAVYDTLVEIASTKGPDIAGLTQPSSPYQLSKRTAYLVHGHYIMSIMSDRFNWDYHRYLESETDYNTEQFIYNLLDLGDVTHTTLVGGGS